MDATCLWELLRQNSTRINAVCAHSVDFMLLFRLLLKGLGLTEDELPSQLDTEKWVGKNLILYRWV